MLLVAIGFMTVGYTLLYAGIKGGPNEEWARAPWQLWVDASKTLSAEAKRTAAQNAAAISKVTGNGQPL